MISHIYYHNLAGDNYRCHEAMWFAEELMTHPSQILDNLPNYLL